MVKKFELNFELKFSKKKNLKFFSGLNICQAKSAVISNSLYKGGGPEIKSCSEWSETCSRFGISEIQ